MSNIMINYIPTLESNDANDNIMKEHNDIRFVYSKLSEKILNNEILNTKVNYIWTSIDKYIMVDLQQKLSNKKDIDIDKINDYIKLLNEYQKYFDFKEYNLIPNSYRELLKINELEDYNEIPEDILNGIKIIFLKDLKGKSIYKGLKIDRIKKITMNDIGEIIEKCFEKKMNEDKLYTYSRIK